MAHGASGKAGIGRPLLRLLTRGSRPWLILVSVAGWMCLVGNGQMLSVPAFCGDFSLLGYGSGWQGIEQALLFNPPDQLLSSWWLMLLAMMPLLLAQPLDYLWRRSPARKRWQAIGLFVLGFAATWTLAGVLLMASVVGARVLVGLPAPVAFVGALLLCVVWQASPAKQRCMNRCHEQLHLSASGWAFIKDCLEYGVVSGGWCIGACWALMLLPMLVEQGHLALMLLTMAWMVLERLQRNRAPQWHWPFLLKRVS
ncbi:copper chaperone [Pseudomonas gingeri]